MYHQLFENAHLTVEHRNQSLPRITCKPAVSGCWFTACIGITMSVLVI
jgi:hypothetical protein